MKRKDIITVVIAVAVILVAGYFVYIMLFPSTKATAVTSKTTVEKTEKVTGNINQETLNKISALKDYGEANLDNVGRVDPFAPIQ